MNDKLLNFLNKAKLTLGISGTLVALVIVFVHMRTDIDANEHRINTVRDTVETLEQENKVEHKEMINLLNTNYTNIKLLQQDADHIVKSIDKMNEEKE